MDWSHILLLACLLSLSLSSTLPNVVKGNLLPSMIPFRRKKKKEIKSSVLKLLCGNVFQINFKNFIYSKLYFAFPKDALIISLGFITAFFDSLGIPAQDIFKKHLQWGGGGL